LASRLETSSQLFTKGFIQGSKLMSICVRKMLKVERAGDAMFEIVDCGNQ